MHPAVTGAGRVARPLLALVGPTASGKTEASIQLAEALGAELVCLDSMLVYRGMDVGTAKPSAEQRARVRHHMVDLVQPSQRFSVATFQTLARRALEDISARGRRPLLVGGSGLYYRAVVDSLRFPSTDGTTRGLLEAEAAVLGPEALHARLAALDAAAAQRIEPSNVRRTVRALEVAAITGRPFSAFATRWSSYRPGAVRAAGVTLSPRDLHERIEERVRGMMEPLIEETSALVSRGLGSFLTASQAIGYAEAMSCLEGLCTPEEAVRRMVKRTKALARRQMAWFRRDPRITWFAAGKQGAAGIVPQLSEYFREPEPEVPVSRRVVEARDQ